MVDEYKPFGNSTRYPVVKSISVACSADEVIEACGLIGTISKCGELAVQGDKVVKFRARVGNSVIYTCYRANRTLCGGRLYIAFRANTLLANQEALNLTAKAIYRSVESNVNVRSYNDLHSSLTVARRRLEGKEAEVKSVRQTLQHTLCFTALVLSWACYELVHKYFPERP